MPPSQNPAVTSPQTAERPRIARGEETRGRLLRATVASLAGNGFAGTTIEVVMQATGISRGSVLHQFPTRMDLMAAAAEFAMNTMVADTTESTSAIPDARRQLEALAEIMWVAHRSDSAIALTEVLMSSRSDRGLARRLTPLAERVETQIDAQVSGIARRAGIADPQPVLAWTRLLIASMRGLVIEFMLQPDRRMILAALDALKVQHLEQVRRWLPAG